MGDFLLLLERPKARQIKGMIALGQGTRIRWILLIILFIIISVPSDVSSFIRSFPQMTTTSSNKSVLSANLVSGSLFRGTSIYPISYNDSENFEYPSRDERCATILKNSNIMQSPEASLPSVREAEGGRKHSDISSTDDTNQRILPPVALNEPSLRPSPSNNNYGSTNVLRDGFRGASVADEEVGFLNNQFPELNKKYKKYIRKWHVTLLWMVFINCIWLVFTILNDYFFTVHFISPNRVAGFQDVSIIFVSVVSNFLATLMSGVSYYSKVDQFTNISLLSFTGINLFLSLVVTFTRGRIGTTGLGTYFWAALSFALSALRERSLYIVTEENKSRSNMHARAYLEAGRRTVKEWINLGMRNLVKILLMAYMALYTINNILHTIDLYRTASLISDIPSPKSADTTEGFFWVDDAQSYRIHIKCYGDVYNNGSSNATSLKPIVLYEHGGLDTGYLSADWIQELYHLNELDRYCIYDRPGYGLSDSPPAPNSMGMIAEGLKHALLKEAGISGPFITVGYDLGGLQTQIFTAKNSDLVKGMMLVDSWHEDILLNKLTRSYGGDGETEIEGSNTIPSIIEKPNSLHLWWKGIVSPISLKLQTSWLFARHGSRERIYGRDIVYQGTYLRAKFLEGITNSMLSYSDVMNSRDKLSQMLTSVVSSKDMIKQNTLWGNWQRELSKISSRTQEWEVVDGGHELYKYSLGKKKLQEVLLRLVKDS